MQNEIEVSVVMPCLNEEATIGACIEKTLEAFRKHDIIGEIVIVDNGSTDASVAIAQSLGARVVHQPERGYGAAYRKGLAEARGKYIVMGDSDDTYDFSEIDRFLGPLREGYDLVMGSRLRGKILPGAMPWLHHYIGVPVLTGLLKFFFKTFVSDAHCGLRAFTREAYGKMHLQTTGMEFASEMIINAVKAGLRITEVPITYHPRAGESKLHSFQDGWRHLRFILLSSPTYLFLLPGLLFFILGMVMLIALLRGPIVVGQRAFDIHLLVLGSLFALLGYQVCSMGIYARTYALTERFERKDVFLEKFYRYFTLERGIYIGLLLLLIGLGANGYVLFKWVSTGFGPLNEVRNALFGLTFIVLGVQTIFSSFFLSILRLRHKQ